MRPAAAVCSLTFAACAAACLLGWAWGGLNPSAAWVCLLLGAAAAAATWAGSAPEVAVRLRFWDGAVLGAFGWAAFRAFFWLYYPDGPDWRVLSPHNLGDLALHLNLIQYLGSGVSFWPPSPILSGEPLTYPIGPDVWNALLLLAGVDLRAGLIGTGFVMALAGGWALWRWAGAFGVAALIFGGGLAGFAIFRTGEFVEYGAEDVWKNAFLTLLVPQRGFLFVLPAGLVLLWAWQREYFEGRRVLPLPSQLLLYAAMPLFQLHAFLVLSAALAMAALFAPRQWRKPTALALMALVPASAAVAAVTGGFAVRGNARWDPWWAMGDHGLRGFLIEFGPALTLAAAAGFVVARRGNRQEWWLYSLCGLTAAVGFLTPLTPWEWDNTKLLIWSWLGLAPLLWSKVLAPLETAPRAALCTLLFFSGAIALAAGLDRRHGYFLATRAEVDEWRMLVRDIPAEAVFAASPDYNHPLLLIGRRVVCGYEGHLASHGLDYHNRLEKLRLVLRQVPGWEQHAAELGADWLALRARETWDGEPWLAPVAKPRK